MGKTVSRRMRAAEPIHKRATPKPGKEQAFTERLAANKPTAEQTLEQLGLLSPSDNGDPPSLTLIDKQTAVELLEANCDDTIEKARSAPLASTAAELLKRELWDLFPFSADAEGLIVKANSAGLAIESGSRRGVLAWDELAADLRDEFLVPDDDNAIDPPAKIDARREDATAKQGTQGITLDALEPNPWQPRQAFDQAAIDELAVSMERNGLIQRILVRPVPGAKVRYQIAAGERRVRAARQLGWKTIAADVRELTDAEMSEVAIAENAKRRDLSDIEKARSYQRHLADFGGTQKDLATQLGISTGELSNTLRLLRLPDAWQQKVIAGTLPGSHARSLVPYAEAPAVLKEMERHLKGEAPSLVEWDDDLKGAARTNSRPLNSSYYYDQSKKRGRKVALKPNDADLAELQVVELTIGGRKEKRALNVAKWEALQSAVEAKRSAAESKKKKAAATTSKKQAPEAAERKAKYAADVFAQKLDEWRHNWLRYLCHVRLGEPLDKLKLPGQFAPLRFLIYNSLNYGEVVDQQDFARELRERKIKAPRPPVPYDQRFKLIDAVPPRELLSVWTAILRRKLWDDGPSQGYDGLEDCDIEYLAADLEIDVAKAWKEGAGWPLMQDYLELHDVEQLGELAELWKITLPADASKAVAVKLLCDDQRNRRSIPKEIRKVGAKK